MTSIPSQYINVYEKNGAAIQKKIRNNLNFLPKITTTLERKENIDIVPNDHTPTVTNEIQGCKEMADATDEIPTFPPVETTQPNTSNESSHNASSP